MLIALEKANTKIAICVHSVHQILTTNYLNEITREINGSEWMRMTKIPRTGEPGMVQTYLIDLKVGKERAKLLTIRVIRQKKEKLMPLVMLAAAM